MKHVWCMQRICTVIMSVNVCIHRWTWLPDFLFCWWSVRVYIYSCLFTHYFIAIKGGATVKFFCLFVCFWRDSPKWARVFSFTMFLDHTQRRATVGRTPLDEWSIRRTDLYLTTHNIHNRQTSMPPVGFEPTIPVSERPKTYALERAATGTGYG
jgi:hypothetical protein